MSRNVVIVGASASLGDAVVEQFRSKGDRVAATRFRGLVERQVEGGVWTLDVQDEKGLESFASKVFSPSKIDVLVYLAGILPGQNLGSYSPNLMRRVMEVNAHAPMRLAALLYGRMAEGGSVLLLGSSSGLNGSFDPIYAASKSALHGFVLSMARWQDRVRFAVLAPTLVEKTAMFRSMSMARREEHRQACGGFLLQPENVAVALYKLSIDANANGKIVPLTVTNAAFELEQRGVA